MRLTKPPKDNPHAVFKYGVECGIDQERDRILEVVTSQGCDCTPDCDRIDMSLTQLVALIKGENK